MAINYYKKATEQINSSERPYSMIAQIYSDLDDKDKALEAYYVVKSKVSKDSDSYINALFNIGLFESFKENYAKAELAFSLHAATEASSALEQRLGKLSTRIWAFTKNVEKRRNKRIRFIVIRIV